MVRCSILYPLKRYEIDAVKMVGFEASNTQIINPKLQKDFLQIFKNELFSDFHVTMRIGFSEYHYNLHSVILKQRAPMMYSEMKRKNVFQPFVSKQCMDAVLKYIYSDKISIPKDIEGEELIKLVQEIEKIGRKFNIQRLVDISSAALKYKPEKIELLSHGIPSTFMEGIHFLFLPFLDCKKMMMDTEMSDIQIHTFNKTFYCHSCILSSRCDFFNALLSRWLNDKSNAIVLDDLSSQTFETLLEHIYTGDIQNVCEDVVFDVCIAGLQILNLFITTGNMYLIEDLTKPFEIILKRIDKENVFDILEISWDFSWKHILEKCEEILREDVEFAAKKFMNIQDAQLQDWFKLAIL